MSHLPPARAIGRTFGFSKRPYTFFALLCIARSSPTCPLTKAGLSPFHAARYVTRSVSDFLISCTSFLANAFFLHIKPLKVYPTTEQAIKTPWSDQFVGVTNNLWRIWHLKPYVKQLAHGIEKVGHPCVTAYRLYKRPSLYLLEPLRSSFFGYVTITKFVHVPIA